MTKITKVSRGGGGNIFARLSCFLNNDKNQKRGGGIMKAFLTAFAAGAAIFMVQTASATQYAWRSAVRSGLFSNYNCWQYKDANNVYQVADASHHLTTADDFSFWLQPSTGIYYVTNDTSIAFNGGQFSFGLIDFTGNLSTKDKTHLRIGTSGTSPYLAVVNKHDGNWTI